MNHVQIKNADCLIEMKNIPDKSIDMILCDLPYGTTACKWDVIIPFEPLWKEYKRIIKDRGCIALFGSEPFSSYLRMSNIKDYKCDWIWEKNTTSGFATAKFHPMKNHEIISIFGKKINFYPIKENRKLNENSKKRLSYTFNGSDCGKNEINNGIKKLKKSIEPNSKCFPKTVQYFPNLNTHERVHPTQKPVALLEYLIKTYTLENETVLDNTMGSGSTGVACINTNRKFIGIEKDETYFNIAKKRIDEARENYQERLF